MRGSLLTLALSFAGQVAADKHNKHKHKKGSQEDAVVAKLSSYGVDMASIAALSGTAASTLSCDTACSALSQLYSTAVLAYNTTDYQSFTTDSYWSAFQSAVRPSCIFTPSSADQVAVFVLLASQMQCAFAVKSGGHAAMAGGSSIEGGITLAFDNMKGIELTSDKSIARIEPGNKWFEVYTALEKDGVGVVGGRVADVGVGGLLLGGGISYFSNKAGWGCDNIASYEVVTARGDIVTASRTDNSDLYWALRGGGGNFGIVTRFDLEAFPQGLMWGGSRFYTEQTFTALMDAAYNLGQNAAQDLNAHQILSYTYTQGMKVASAELDYASPVANAPIMSEYNAIPPLMDDTGIKSLANATVGLSQLNPNGLRQRFWTSTYKLDREFLTFATEAFYQELLPVNDTEALVFALSFQVLTVPMLEASAAKGRNALGLSARDGPLLLLQTNVRWALPSDDDKILGAQRRVMENIEAEGKRRGLFEDYVYLNYASEFQEVFQSYGAENHEMLKEVAKKYDPQGIFQVLQPGYFRLGI